MVNQESDKGSLLWSAAACRRFSFFHTALGGQPCKRLRQHQRTPRNIFRRGILIWPMAVTIPAGDEEHPRRSDPRNEKGIVISPADHLEKGKSMLAAGIGEIGRASCRERV